MRTYTSHSVETYDRAMDMKGRVSSATASRLTGVHKQTILRWWRGGGPAARYYDQIRQGEKPRPPGAKHRRVGRCPQKRREAQMRYYYRSSRHARFHPQWNPNPEVAPLHTLWLRASDVIPFVLGRWPADEVVPQLDRDGGSRRRWQEMVLGRQDWIRLDAADSLLSTLGLVISEMQVEPTYSPRPPKETA